MMTKIKKICNFRAIFFLFLLVMVCIYGAVKVYGNRLYLLLLVFPVAFFVYVGAKRRFVLLGISVAILCGVCASCYIKIKNFDNCFVPEGQVAIVATVEKITLTSTGDHVYYFRDLQCGMEGGEVVRLDGNATMFVNGSSSVIDAGRFDRIAFVGKIVKNEAKSSTGMNNFCGDIRYKLYIATGVHAVKVEKDANLIEKFRENNLKILIANLGEENGNICYSILFGDRATVPTYELNGFRQSGVMHLFAVSGLHVGLLVAVVVWLLSRFGVGGKVQFFSVSVFLLAYCILCSFTPSVVRASIMSVCLLLSKLFERKYDPLNALSLAGIILLSLSPSMFFSVGFQLSFAAVFGIISLSKIFNLVKFKSAFMQEFWNTTKLSLSAQIGVAPILLNYFGTLTTWTFVANLFLIPIFTLFFSLLFVCNFIVLIIPAFGVILKFPGVIFDVFVYFNSLILSLPGSEIEFSRGNVLAIALYMALLWCSSGYLVVSQRARAAVAIVLVLAISLCLFLPLGTGDNIAAFQNLPTKDILAQKCGEKLLFGRVGV